MFTERFIARVKALKLKSREQRSVCEVTLESSLTESQIEDLGTQIQSMLYGANGDQDPTALPFAKTELLIRFNDRLVTFFSPENPDDAAIQIASADVSKITFVRSDDKDDTPIMRLCVSSEWQDPHLLFLANRLGCEVDVEIKDRQLPLFEADGKAKKRATKKDGSNARRQANG